MIAQSETILLVDDDPVFRERLSRAMERRGLRVLELRGQPVDHPWSLAFPEGRYLQFILCVVD